MPSPKKSVGVVPPLLLKKLHPDELILGGPSEYINPIRRLAGKVKKPKARPDGKA